MIKRFIGPFLMIAFGAVLLLGPGEPSPIDVGGSTTPCTTLPASAGVFDPCSTTTTIDPCGPQVGVVNPCTTTTTVVTTTTEAPVDPCDVSAVGVFTPCTTTTVAETTTTVADGSTTTEPPAVDGTTSQPSDALPADASNTPPAATAGELPRTGSDNGPLTVAGISLIVVGFGLAVYERRSAIRRRTA